MRTIDYDKKNKNTGNVEGHIATDEAMDKKFGNIQRAYAEGFAASDGIWGGTAETEGWGRYPEQGDDSRPGRDLYSIENENPGLADN